MPTLICTATVELDGRPAPDSPRVVTLTAPLARTFDYQVAPGGLVFIAPALSEFQQLTAFLFTTTAPLTLFLNGQSGTGVPLLAGAVVAFVRMADDTGFPLLALTNGGAINARVRGVALGTPSV